MLSLLLCDLLINLGLDWNGASPGPVPGPLRIPRTHSRGLSSQNHFYTYPKITVFVFSLSFSPERELEHPRGHVMFAVAVD